MARLVLTVACSLALVAPGESLLCWVCLPRVAGEVESRDLAVRWIATIARKWPGVTQLDLGYCHDFDNGEKFQKVCDHGYRKTACISAFNSEWEARTCGPLPEGVKGDQCLLKEDGVTVCYRLADLSNLGGTLLPGLLPPLLLILLPILTIY